MSNLRGRSHSLSFETPNLYDFGGDEENEDAQEFVSCFSQSRYLAQSEHRSRVLSQRLVTLAQQTNDEDDVPLLEDLEVPVTPKWEIDDGDDRGDSESSGFSSTLTASIKSPWCVRFSMFICGVGIFARTEAFLLQTQLYNICFANGVLFYAKANAALFLPGVAVLLLQSKYDHLIDARFGTLRSNLVRIILTTILTIAMILGYILSVYENIQLVRDEVFIYATLVVVGICTSLTYGAFSQIVALIPSKFHYYFFTGTMCPFFVFLPVNILTGDLCDATTIDDSENSSVLYHIDWRGVIIFYATACGLTVLSFLSLLAVTNSCKSYITRKDQLLSYSKMSSSINSAHVLHNTGLTVGVIVREIRWELATYAISVITSLYVASKYSSIPAATFTNLETFLLYEYYIASAIGMVMTEWKRIRAMSTSLVLFVISCLRVLVVPATIVVAKPLLDVQLSNDYIVLVVNGLFMLSGGFLFSIVFSQACAKFEDEPSKARASTIMNIVYYLSMSVSIVISLLT